MSVDRKSPFPAPPECTAALHWRKGKQAIVGFANVLVSRSCVAKTTLRKRAARPARRTRRDLRRPSQASLLVYIIYIVAEHNEPREAVTATPPPDQIGSPNDSS